MTRPILLAALLCACNPPPDWRAIHVCVEHDYAAENAAIVACIAAGQRMADDDADELADSCFQAMRGSMCSSWAWFYEERRGWGGNEHWARLYLCDRAFGVERSRCRDHGWDAP